MKIPVCNVILAIIGSLFLSYANLQAQYNDHRTMIQKSNALAKEYPSLCSVNTLVKSKGDREIIVLSIGTGDRDKKPGIAIVGGIDGSHLLGKELALGFAATLLKESGSPDIKNLLGKITFYVFPDVNPDATEQYFSKLKYERNTNSRPVDEDKDFITDEDPYEDLNSDGFITLIRVNDPSGSFMECPDDKRVMMLADLSEGQAGSYMVYSEGIDNDKDGKFNEDGPGGVNFNRNLTYDYEEFGVNAGLHPVSEPETKAVLDFLFDHFNIYATFAFGTQNNLAQDPQDRQAGARGQASGEGQDPSAGQTSSRRQGSWMRQNRKITSVLESDDVIIKHVAKRYREITGVKGSPPVKPAHGNFMDWSYYHYGRYSFSTPAWWFPAEKNKNMEAEFLKYASENNMDDVFVPWTEIDHPDFPGKKTEAGGIKPFVMINPPADKLEELITKNYEFIVEIAAMHPELEFLDADVENMGDNVFRVSVKVHNKGIFATCTEAGENNIFNRIMRITIDINDNQKLLSGHKVQSIQRLEGDCYAEFSWLILGKGAVKITAGAINTGTANTSLELK
jgi:hypothetical protein